MTEKRDIVVIGAGDYAQNMIDLFSLEDRLAYIFDAPRFEGESKYGVPVIKMAGSPDLQYVSLIGEPPHKRELIKELEEYALCFSSTGFKPHYFNLLNSTNDWAKSVKTGIGVSSQAYVCVNTRSVIGNHVLLGNHVVVGHDCEIGDYSTIYAGTILSGHTIIGEGVEMGAGSRTIPKVKIGDWSVVGAGAVVTRDIPSFSVAYARGVKAEVHRVIEKR